MHPSDHSRDFVDVYPRLCVVCTSLPKSEFPSEASARWVTDNCGVALGSHLGMKTADEVRALIEQFKKRNDFCIQLMCEVPASLLLSESLAAMADVYLDALGLNKSQYRSVSMVMQDVYERTDYVRFCWYFLK
jgi:hypothetical protein